MGYLLPHIWKDKNNSHMKINNVSSSYRFSTEWSKPFPEERHTLFVSLSSTMNHQLRCTHTYVQPCIYPFLPSYVYGQIHPHIRTRHSCPTCCTHTHTHTHTAAPPRIHTHTHTHTDTHTHTHARAMLGRMTE